MGRDVGIIDAESFADVGTTTLARVDVPPPMHLNSNLPPHNIEEFKVKYY